MSHSSKAVQTSAGICFGGPKASPAAAGTDIWSSLTVTDIIEGVCAAGFTLESSAGLDLIVCCSRPRTQRLRVTGIVRKQSRYLRIRFKKPNTPIVIVSKDLPVIGRPHVPRPYDFRSIDVCFVIHPLN